MNSLSANQPFEAEVLCFIAAAKRTFEGSDFFALNCLKSIFAAIAKACTRSSQTCFFSSINSSGAIPSNRSLSKAALHYGLLALLSGCSPRPLARTQFPAHYQLNDLIGCMVFLHGLVGFEVALQCQALRYFCSFLSIPTRDGKLSASLVALSHSPIF